MDRALVRAAMAVALLLVLAILAGVARRAIAMPTLSVAAATGIIWLVGCAAVAIWIVFVVAVSYRDRWSNR